MSFGFGVGDIIRVAELAISIYRDLYVIARGAPQEFQLLLGEISTISNALKILQDDLVNPGSVLVRAGEDRIKMACEIVHRVAVTLGDLQKAAKKYGIINDGPKRKRIWIKLKWSLEFRSIDSLRGKLVYHNAVMNLLLTSIGNSSLDRIESSNRLLQTDITEIKSHIHASSTSNNGPPSSTLPTLSVVEDEFFKISLSAALVQNAEILQPWGTIGVDRWIQGGKWWLLKSQMELHSVTPGDNKGMLQGYTDLIKASWILIDVIASHPQLSFLDQSTHFEVQLLSMEIKEQFQKIARLGLVVPSLSELESQDLQVWETQAQKHQLQPRKRAQRSSISEMYDNFWEVRGEKIFFQRFGFYQRHGLAELACVVLFLVHEIPKVARMIVLDQNGISLIEALVQPHVQPKLDGGSIRIGNETIKFPAPKASSDSRLLYSIFQASELYFLSLKRGNLKVDDFHYFILLHSVKSGNKDEVEQLMKSHATSNDAVNYNSTPHFSSIALQLGSELVSSQLDRTSHSLEMPLPQWAVQNGHIELVQLLLVMGVDTTPNPGYLNMNLVEIAVACGQLEVLQLLLKNIANINEVGPEALLKAVRSGHRRTLKLLLEIGGYIDANAFMGHAAYWGQKDIVQLLIDYGADVNAIHSGMIPLNVAIESQNIEVIQLLLDHGANIALWNSLHHAADVDNRTVAQLLIDNGASLSQKNFHGETPIFFAARRGATEVLQLLLERGQNITDKDDEGMTLLQLAAMYGRKATAQLLIEQGADLSATGITGRTLLHIAVPSKAEDLLELLINNGADVSAKDYNSETPLHLAVRRNLKGIVEFLISNGADVAAKDSLGWTPLHKAAHSGYEGIAELLIDNGADLSATDSVGNTPLLEATQFRRERVVQLLVRRGQT